MTLMGGPIDTRRNPTAVNNLAAEPASTGFAVRRHPRCRFASGVMRDVYPASCSQMALSHEISTATWTP